MNYRRVWTPQEDQIILELVQQYGSKNWAVVAAQLTKRLNQRTGKQCRERWHNHLHPNIQKKIWSQAEERRLFELHKIHGNKWTVIAQSLNGRTDNSIKNYFYSTIRRSLRRMGKFVGSKNSTAQMKKIKPSILSKIFAVDDQPSHRTHLPPQEKQFLQYITQNCDSIRDQIVQFVTYKPKIKDCSYKNDKERYQKVISKMVEMNSIYEKMKLQDKRRRDQEKIFQNDYQKLIDSQSQIQKEQSSFNYAFQDNKAAKKLKSQRKQHKDDSKQHEQNTFKIDQNVQGCIEVMMPKAVKGINHCNLDDISESIKQSHEQDQDPYFNIELRDDLNYQITPNYNNNAISPGYFFNTPTNINIHVDKINVNPFNYFQSPSTPYVIDSYFNSLQALSGLQNSAINQFQVSIQKEIQQNLSRQERKMLSSGNLNTICSPGSAFRYFGSE